MFSGRWEDCLDHDSNGRIFLDFDPYSFQQILTMLRCRPFDLANNTVPPEAIITPDKLHAYKCLVDYLGLEGVCGAADESSTLPSDACQLTHVSDNAIVTQGMAKGQWGTCVSPTKNHYAVANAGPRMSEQQVLVEKGTHLCIWEGSCLLKSLKRALHCPDVPCHDTWCLLLYPCSVHIP